MVNWMNGYVILGALLIALGAGVLVFHQFTYVEKTHQTDIGPIQIQVKDKKTVDVPAWIGVFFVACGGAAVLFGTVGESRRLIGR